MSVRNSCAAAVNTVSTKERKYVPVVNVIVCINHLSVMLNQIVLNVITAMKKIVKFIFKQLLLVKIFAGYALPIVTTGVAVVALLVCVIASVVCCQRRRNIHELTRMKQ